MGIFEEYIRIKSDNPFAKLLGIRALEMKEGYARGEMEVQPSFVNTMGTVHGGCLYSLADTVSGLAAASYGFRASTVSGALNYLRPGTNTSKLYAEAKAVKHGRTLYVLDVDVTDERGVLLAKGMFTYYNLGMPLMKE